MPATHTVTTTHFTHFCHLLLRFFFMFSSLFSCPFSLHYYFSWMMDDMERGEEAARHGGEGEGRCVVMEEAAEARQKAHARKCACAVAGAECAFLLVGKYTGALHTDAAAITPLPPCRAPPPLLPPPHATLHYFCRRRRRRRACRHAMPCHVMISRHAHARYTYHTPCRHAAFSLLPGYRATPVSLGIITIITNTYLYNPV